MNKPLHPLQVRMLDLATQHDIANMRLVDIRVLLGEDIALQRIKHHREQLIKNGIMQDSGPSKKVKVVKVGGIEMLRIPILEFRGEQ